MIIGVQIEITIQADIVAAALDTSGGHHLLGALPTGFGKSLPMFVLALLLPPGKAIKHHHRRNVTCHQFFDYHDYHDFHH